MNIIFTHVSEPKYKALGERRIIFLRICMNLQNFVNAGTAIIVSNHKHPYQYRYHSKGFQIIFHFKASGDLVIEDL